MSQPLIHDVPATGDPRALLQEPIGPAHGVPSLLLERFAVRAAV
jgi:hypothetical protein